MLKENDVLVMDIDGTLCEVKTKDQSYLDVAPKHNVVNKLREYKNKGFHVILFTSRQMRTYNGNIGKINANTAKTLFEWLDKHEIPYDEVHFGKPWCGHNGYYVDDKAIRPSEFANLSYEEVMDLLRREK
jgi:capsule biosynthesis phosphatase